MCHVILSSTLSKAVLLSPFYRQGNRGTEKVNNWSKILLLSAVAVKFEPEFPSGCVLFSTDFLWDESPTQVSSWRIIWLTSSLSDTWHLLIYISDASSRGWHFTWHVGRTGWQGWRGSIPGTCGCKVWSLLSFLACWMFILSSSSLVPFDSLSQTFFEVYTSWLLYSWHLFNHSNSLR